jgi:hypothetical protein
MLRQAITTWVPGSRSSPAVISLPMPALAPVTMQYFPITQAAGLVKVVRVVEPGCGCDLRSPPAAQQQLSCCLADGAHWEVTGVIWRRLKQHS